MITGKQLGKIESQLKAFAMTDNIENLTKACSYLMDLISHLRHKEAKECSKRLHTKLQILLNK